MMVRLLFSAIIKFLLGALIVALLIFLPAGTFNFFGGILLMALLFIPMFFAGIIMLFKNPSLLKERLDAKEKEKEQSNIIKLSGLMFILGFIAAGLDFRFSISPVPKIISIISAIIFLIAYLLYAEVLRENAYLSRTIKVQKNQTVIDTGLYSKVRHPMYSATLLLFLSMPLILGSLLSFIIFLAYPFIIAHRIKHEEAFLEKELSGYSEYKQKVKYKLIPFIW